MDNRSLPVVVIVGRPNVGKSTLFNRLCEKRRALATDVPGTTRDWIEGTAYWGARVFRVIDTGGYAPGDEDVITAVRSQVERWITRADAVMWMVDGREGLTPSDESLVPWIRRRSKAVLVVVNKVDDRKKEALTSDFYRLGFPKIISISATHGRNVNGMLDELETLLPPLSADETPEEDRSIPRVAIVGRPNVGKSSLFNRLLGEERMIVSNVPGTTRDSIDTLLEHDGKKILLMDTAGLRSKKSKAVGLEGLTRIMAERALDRCEVSLLILDAGEGLMDGDVAVGRLIDQKMRACVVGINKWDLVQDRAPAVKWYRDRHSADMPFLAYCPLVFLSAKTGYHVPELMEEILKAHAQFYRRFDPQALTDFFWAQVQERPYSRDGNKMIFHSAVQVAAAPPTFLFRTNLAPGDVHFSYQRHLENVFRKHHGLDATPLVFKFKRGKK